MQMANCKCRTARKRKIEEGEKSLIAEEQGKKMLRAEKENRKVEEANAKKDQKQKRIEEQRIVEELVMEKKLKFRRENRKKLNDLESRRN